MGKQVSGDEWMTELKRSERGSEARESTPPFFQSGSPLVAEQRVSLQRTSEWLTEGCLPTAGEVWGQALMSCQAE